MTIISRLRLLYLCHFSNPRFNCPVYRAISRCRAKKIVELGVGDGQRAMRMIEVARRASASSEIHYVGMDPFEGRGQSSGPALSLKAAHRLLRGSGGRVQLVPGNPADSLARVANSLGKVDLLIVPAEFDSLSFARLWYFVPRMLHERSLVFIDSPLPDGERCVRRKPREEVERLALFGTGRRAA